MIKWLKKRYNLWLFKKYGFNRGLFFERIPVIYKLIPLWSPSQYGCCDYYPRPDHALEKAIKAVSEMDVQSGVPQSVYVIEE